MGFFPVDAETLRYLRQTGRSEEEVQRVERYTKEQGIFRTDQSPDPEYSETLELDLAAVTPSLAGPKRPQDRVPLSAMKSAFRQALAAPVKERGFGLSPEETDRVATVAFNGDRASLTHGSVVIAAITSCTNTSNPSVMLGAGLLAKKAAERGLQIPPYVKTSLAPGSKVVTEYLKAAGLIEPLAALHFNLVGYGCTTCIGNSGPLPPEVAKAVTENQLVAAAVLSGNRNFEGRVHPQVRANYLASPPLVVAYALAGSVDIDLDSEPLGKDRSGRPVYLRDIWPSQEEVAQAMERAIRPEMFRESYANVWDGNPTWNAIPVAGGALYEWRPDSTYIQEPPFFTDLGPSPAAHCRDPRSARARSARRLHHYRPHFARRQHSGGESRGTLSDRARCGEEGLQLLWLAPGQRPRDGARDLREHPVEEPACGRYGGRRHSSLPGWRTHVDLRCRDAL